MSYASISYSRKDKDYTHRLVDDLESNRFKVWIDKEDIQTDEKWRESLKNAVRRCAVFVVVMTPDSNTSDWCKNELTWAKKWEKPILPLYLKDVPINTASELFAERIDAPGTIRLTILPPFTGGLSCTGTYKFHSFK